MCFLWHMFSVPRKALFAFLVCVLCFFTAGISYATDINWKVIRGPYYRSEVISGQDSIRISVFKPSAIFIDIHPHQDDNPSVYTGNVNVRLLVRLQSELALQLQPEEKQRLRQGRILAQKLLVIRLVGMKEEIVGRRQRAQRYGNRKVKERDELMLKTRRLVELDKFTIKKGMTSIYTKMGGFTQKTRQRMSIQNRLRIE